ncbi:MAG: DoxX family protein [Xanthobacteraceae bacterium]
MNGNPSSHPYLSCTDGIVTAGQDALLLVARVLAAWIFVQSGWGKITNLSEFAMSMANAGVPEFLGYIGPFAEFLGGVGLLVGLGTRYAALVLILFTAAATWIAHGFWAYPPEQQALQAIQFWKNVTIIGGLLALFVTAGGRLSIDNAIRPAA